jgi:hypothetical protein
LPSSVEDVASLTTPDVLEVSAGRFVFDSGVPTPETAELVYRQLDLMHAVQAYLNGLPAVSLWAMREGMRKAGIADGDVLLFSGLMDSTSLFLTANADTVYYITFLDLSAGPLMVDIPQESLTVADDMWFRWITDLGVPGPDRGAGGRYLFTGPGYDGPLPEGGMFTARSRTRRVILLGRAFLTGNDPAPAVARIREQLKITPFTPGGYGSSIAAFLSGDAPLTQPGDPATPRFVEGTGLELNTVPPAGTGYFAMLADAIAAEPAAALDPEVAAPIAAAGIVHGQEFAPPERQAAILAEAAATANAYARTVAMLPRRQEGFHYYPGSDSNWTSPLFTGGYTFRTPPPRISADGIKPFPDPGATMLNARASFFYLATGITPAMCMNLPGIGSQYLGATVDAHGQPLHGASMYKLVLPAGIPAGKFWSVTAYDNQTRSMVDAPQRFPRAGSQSFPGPAAGTAADGSVTIWFGPDKPGAAADGNWVQTVPGRGWFAIARFYSPLPAFFDKTWRPGEIEPAG